MVLYCGDINSEVALNAGQDLKAKSLIQGKSALTKKLVLEV